MKHTHVLFFVYGDKAYCPTISVDDIKEGNWSILCKNEQESIIFKRVLRFYTPENVIFLIKPKKLKYWLQSVAVRDANDVVFDLSKVGC